MSIWLNNLLVFKAFSLFEKMCVFLYRVGEFITEAFLSGIFAVSPGLMEPVQQCLYPEGKVTFRTSIIKLYTQSAKLSIHILTLSTFFYQVVH